jgi:hypothetical protein
VASHPLQSFQGRYRVLGKRQEMGKLADQAILRLRVVYGSPWKPPLNWPPRRTRQRIDVIKAGAAAAFNL